MAIWKSEFVLDESLLATTATSVARVEAIVVKALTACGWSHDPTLRSSSVELGLDGAGHVRVRMWSSADARVVATQLSRQVGPIVLLQARCDGFKKPVVDLHRYEATDGALAATALDPNPADRLRGPFSDRFNETYDAIDDRVRALLAAGLAASGLGQSARFSRQLMLRPTVQGTTPRLQELVKRARSAQRFELAQVMERAALVTVDLDGAKQTAFLSDAEHAELQDIFADD